MNINEIDALVFDFDGVLTDNKVYVDQSPEAIAKRVAESPNPFEGVPVLSQLPTQQPFAPQPLSSRYILRYPDGRHPPTPSWPRAGSCRPT